MRSKADQPLLERLPLVYMPIKCVDWVGHDPAADGTAWARVTVRSTASELNRNSLQDLHMDIARSRDAD